MTQPVIRIYPNREAKPHECVQLHDQEETWAELLNNPEVVQDEAGKRAASVICGAKYFDDVDTRDKEGVESVSCLVLDVDDEDVPDEAALRTALEGLRSIVYASPSHTAAKPRWRVLLPLASPLPPKKHRSLVSWCSENLFEGHKGCINVKSTGDPCRLGFVGITKNPDDYVWWSQPGELLDWTWFLLEDETWLHVPLNASDLDRQPQWTDRETALQFAMKAYGSRGYEDVKSGDHRTDVLWHAAMNLWWEWAAEDEAFVLTVLHHINEQFPEAKDEDEIIRKMTEAHGRTVGANRKPQFNGPYGSKREPSNTVSEAAIKHLAKRLRRSIKPAVARVGDEMTRMISGNQTIADDPSTWRSALGRVSQQLASSFVHDKPERIAQEFNGCLKTMLAAVHGEQRAVPTLEEITSWITVKLEGEKKRRAENMARDEGNTRRSIELATGGKRDTKYKMEEVDAWMSPNGCGLNHKSWLLVSGKGYFVFVDGAWAGPYSEAEFDAQGYTDLEAAAEFIRTRVYNEEKATWSYIPLKQLLQKHGSKCNTCIDFSCERSYFRSEDRTLVLAGPILNDIEPTFHTDVDAWLRVMTGRDQPVDEKARQAEAGTALELDDYDAVCNWLACLTQLDHVCAALYLQGPTKLGKSLFADGIAKIWKGGKIPINAAVGHFNSMLTASPLIHVEEGMPKGMSSSILLRRVLAEREHVYTRKNVDSGKITGCVRMLFTANNLDIFNQDKEKFKKDDIDALADRFVHIRVKPEAADFLTKLANHHEFVTKNMLAEHTKWLNERRFADIKRRGLRFLVAGRNTNVSDVVATNDDATSDVCNAIAEAFREGRKNDFCVVKKGKIWVNIPALRLQISLQNTAARYTSKDIARAVASVSTGKKKIRIKEKTLDMWDFRLPALEAWCENTSVFDWPDVQAGILKLDESPITAENPPDA